MDGGATMDGMADEPDDTGNGNNGTDSIEGLRRESARWRSKLREAETERDGLRTRLDQAQRSEVTRLASEHLANPADLLLVVNLDDLRGEDGFIDTDRAQAAIETLVSERPHFAKAPANGGPLAPGHPEVHGGAREPDRPMPSFGQQLKAVRG